MKRLLILLAVALLTVLATAPQAMAADATKVSARGSAFGTMLWAPQRQAIYMFENDGPSKSRCYGACAKAWPPVLTEEPPRAGRGIDEDLLGTTRRRNGDLQVTYAGKPLYTYDHEGPRQVFCHDIDLNGGFWWVLGPDGEPRP